MLPAANLTENVADAPGAIEPAANPLPWNWPESSPETAGSSMIEAEFIETAEPPVLVSVTVWAAVTPLPLVLPLAMSVRQAAASPAKTPGRPRSARTSSGARPLPRSPPSRCSSERAVPAARAGAGGNECVGSVAETNARTSALPLLCELYFRKRGIMPPHHLSKVEADQGLPPPHRGPSPHI